MRGFSTTYNHMDYQLSEGIKVTSELQHYLAGFPLSDAQLWSLLVSVVLCVWQIENRKTRELANVAHVFRVTACQLHH